MHAHRGGAALAPENTIEAFEAAVGLGVDWIELDVQTCASGELVVIHEPDLARLAGDPRRVCDLTRTELRSIDVGSHFAIACAGARVTDAPGLQHTPGLAAGDGRALLLWHDGPQVAAELHGTFMTAPDPLVGDPFVLPFDGPVAGYPADAAHVTGGVFFVSWAEGDSPDLRLRGAFVRP